VNIKGITIVKTNEDCERVLEILYKNKDRVHSWDTETIDIDVKEVSPVKNGKILCASCFIGPEIDFGNGPRLFIDNFG
jgi:DNA polymerase-1